MGLGGIGESSEIEYDEEGEDEQDEDAEEHKQDVARRRAHGAQLLHWCSSHWCT